MPNAMNDIDELQASLLRSLASAHRLRILHLLGRAALRGQRGRPRARDEPGDCLPAPRRHAKRGSRRGDSRRSQRDLPAQRPADPRRLRPHARRPRSPPVAAWRPCRGGPRGAHRSSAPAVRKAIRERQPVHRPVLGHRRQAPRSRDDHGRRGGHGDARQHPADVLGARCVPRRPDRERPWPRLRRVAAALERTGRACRRDPLAGDIPAGQGARRRDHPRLRRLARDARSRRQRRWTRSSTTPAASPRSSQPPTTARSSSSERHTDAKGVRHGRAREARDHGHPRSEGPGAGDDPVRHGLRGPGLRCRRRHRLPGRRGVPRPQGEAATVQAPGSRHWPSSSTTSESWAARCSSARRA